MVRRIRERVRQQYPQGDQPGLRLPNLMPVVHARDQAESKVAAIGRVNPRPGGTLNQIIQTMKKLVARALDWHVRDQIDFNRGTIRTVEALLEAMTENNRALVEIGSRIDNSTQRLDALQAKMDAMGSDWDIRMQQLRSDVEAETSHMKDVRTHWTAWRPEWERKLSLNETQFLRSLADLQLAFSHRATLMESNYREMLNAQNKDFHVELARRGEEIQKRVWKDMEAIQINSNAQVHDELRMLRTLRRELTAAQAAPAAPKKAAKSAKAAEVAPPVPVAPADSGIDWMMHAMRFRGPEEVVSRTFSRYVETFSRHKDILDIGCGRGEFLALVPAARGIDLNPDCVALCREQSLNAEVADAFTYLAALPDESLGGIFCGQMVEHVPRLQLPALIALCAAKLRPGAPIVFETPNPECLAIFATHFYLDPTHQHPVPPKLMAFYLLEAGFESIEIERFSFAAEAFPTLEALPGPVRDQFFGGMDYSISAIKR
ncbi:MAG: class I SAM-dependent methyltransferase [Acidobacteria bacterium]|nr:class I SAM-dependent methyltransferase [Acidobacteriota bacterium]